MRRQILRLQNLWGPTGPAEASVIQQITWGPQAQVAPGSVCSICLDSCNEDTGSSTGAVRWRSLPCHHVFHEACLVQWLERAHNCPVCRLYLHEAYLDTSSTTQTEPV